MYSMYCINETVRVPPKEFGGKLEENILKLAREEYEGVLDEDMGVVVAIAGVENVGEGKVVPGDGAAYYNADISMLVYKPEVQELVEGVVSEITEFGAFVRIGPVEGLVHVSQIMDDYINYDAKIPCFVGKETNRQLKKGDTVTARVVTVSFKNSISNSKIGLTMRQDGLGKEDWPRLAAKTKAKAGGKPSAKEKDEKEKGGAKK